MSNTILSIAIDKREPAWIKSLDFGVPVANDVILDAGDLWVATSDSAMLVIERKTVPDLLGSISDRRLFNQVTRMRELSPWCYVVITGMLTWDGTGKIIVNHNVTGWDMAAVQGALLTVQELGAGVIFCANDDDFVSCVERLAKRERGEVHIRPVRQPNILSPEIVFLTSLTGIGWDKAKALLKHCGTPAWALSHLTRLNEDGVPGIGDGIKRSVRKVLELEPDMELWPIARDGSEENS